MALPMNDKIPPTNPAHPRFKISLQSWPPLPDRNSTKPLVVRQRELYQWKVDYWDMACIRSEVNRLIAEIPEEEGAN